MELAVGDIVSRISYNHDLLFRIQTVKKDFATLYGEDYRLEVDAPIDDLVLVKKDELLQRKKEQKQKEDYSFRLFKQDYQLMRKKREYESSEGFKQEIKHFHISPQVLHIDGDPIFLKKCIALYQQLGMQVHGLHLNEKEMPEKIRGLLEKIQPDILVITGHDSFSKNKGTKNDLRAYRHSKYFGETVREARKYMPSLDQLVIFSGACQSHFESLIRAGSNFASSPSRINIHALDPVYIVAKIGFTSFMEKVKVWDVLRNTMTGEKGIGGIETRGLFRTGMPYLGEDEIEKSLQDIEIHPN